VNIPLDELAAHYDSMPMLAGKLTRDVPELAAFRRKFRWRFYRLADAGMFLAIFNLIVALSPHAFLWWLNTIAAGAALWMVFKSEGTARLLSRQLNRPAAKQPALDTLGRFDE